MTGRVIPPEDAGRCNNAEGCDNCEHYNEDDDMPTGMTVVWVKWIFLFTAVMVLLLFICVAARAEEIPSSRAINAIIGEAESEGAIGMESVACAIRNRGHLRGVYGEKSNRVVNKLYSEKTYNIAKAAWTVSENKARCDALIGSATHWEGTAFKTPYWAKDIIVTATIGRQRFYK
jgi:hypothetical protein